MVIKVAMQKPGSCVISYELECHCIACIARHHCIPSHGGIKIVIGGHSLTSYDGETMPMKMLRMGSALVFIITGQCDFDHFVARKPINSPIRQDGLRILSSTQDLEQNGDRRRYPANTIQSEVYVDRVILFHFISYESVINVGAIREWKSWGSRIVTRTQVILVQLFGFSVS